MREEKQNVEDDSTRIESVIEGERERWRERERT